MKKIIYTFYGILSLYSTTQLTGQSTTAKNFTCNDCNGTSHDLFTELDAGKVVVMAWVMPCGACSGPAKTAHNVVQSYQSTNPGKVVFYLVDDYGNTSCQSLSSWGTSNIGNNITAKFSNAAISMNDYGTIGMPKVVVLGGTNHKVYFNEDYSAAGNSTAIQSAINQVLTTGIEERIRDIEELKAYLVSADELNISFTLKTDMEVAVTIFDVTGKKVFSLPAEKLNADRYIISVVDIATYPVGSYFVKVNDSSLGFLKSE